MFVFNFLKELLQSHTNEKWVEVTIDDIRNGQPCNSHQCPVALAMTRCLGSKWVVGLRHAHKQGDQGKLEHPLPETATKFIAAFDRGEKVSPIYFVLGD